MSAFATIVGAAAAPALRRAGEGKLDRMGRKSTATNPSTPQDPKKRGEAPLQEFAIEAARLLADLRCEDVKLLDVRGISQVCDFVLIASGTSERQMKSVASDVEELGETMGHPVFRSNRDTGNTWIVTDFVDLVAHLFEPSHRAYYDLEHLWSDARVVEWARPAGEKPTGPGATIAARSDADEE